MQPQQKWSSKIQEATVVPSERASYKNIYAPCPSHLSYVRGRPWTPSWEFHVRGGRVLLLPSSGGTTSFPIGLSCRLGRFTKYPTYRSNLFNTPPSRSRWSFLALPRNNLLCVNPAQGWRQGRWWRWNERSTRSGRTSLVKLNTLGSSSNSGFSPAQVIWSLESSWKKWRQIYGSTARCPCAGDSGSRAYSGGI